VSSTWCLNTKRSASAVQATKSCSDSPSGKRTRCGAANHSAKSCDCVLSTSWYVLNCQALQNARLYLEGTGNCSASCNASSHRTGVDLGWMPLSRDVFCNGAGLGLSTLSQGKIFSADGLLTGNCTLAENFKLTQQPSGTLTVDRACHVVGTIAYTVCDPINGACSKQSDYVVRASVSLWRSGDGSRLSGFQSWSCSVGGRGCGRTPPPNVLPFELIQGE
jgi:hypothetical protein